MRTMAWDRATTGVPNGRRSIHVTERTGGLFTHGHNPGYVDLERKIMNADVQDGLTGRTKIVTLARPYRDTEYVPRTDNSKIMVCPGCGIVPPRGRRCDQCWG